MTHTGGRFARLRPASRLTRGTRVTGMIFLVLGALPLAGCGALGLGGNDSPRPAVEPALESPATTRAAAEMALGTAPTEPYWPYRLAELDVAADSVDSAISHLKQSLAVEATYAPALSLLSRLYYEAGRHDEAIALLQPYVDANATAPDAIRASLALHLEASGDYERASQTLSACNGDAPEVLAARALVALRLNDAKNTLSSAKAALDHDPKNAAYHNNYGLALLCAGRPADARDAFQAALAIDNRLASALYNMAVVETFYFCDDAEGKRWFARYKELASADPDNLMGRFDPRVTTSGPR